MEEAEETIEKRSKKIVKWLKNPYNLALIGIILFAIILRFYYFWITKTQPLWWDEASYMATAKNYAGLANYPLEIGRLPGFPLFMSIFFFLGITSEPIMRFFGLFIPSILLIILTYIVIKEMYPDKRIALISTAIISVLWESLFYSNRFQTENIALIFEFLAIIILFVCYIKKQDILFIKSKHSLIWIAIFCILSILFRPGDIIFFPALLIFIILINLKGIFGSRRNILISSLFIIILIFAAVFVLFNLSKIPIISSNYHPENPIAWNSLTVFYGLYQSLVPWIPSLFFYFLLIGLFLFFLDMYLLYPKLKKMNRSSEDIEIKSDIFNILLILSVLISFIFMIRPPNYEFRWFFPFLPGVLAFTSKGIIRVSEFASGLIKIKKLAIFLIILITVLGVYTQVYHADPIIKSKLDSYEQVREAGLWIRENSDKTDTVLSASVPQNAYYSERKTYGFEVNETEAAFDKRIKEIKPNYMIISIFEPSVTPKWAYDWPQKNNMTLTPVQEYYYTEGSQNQLALVIYKFNYNNSQWNLKT